MESRSAGIQAPLTPAERKQVRQWLEQGRDRAIRAADRATASANEILQRKGDRDPCAYLSPAAAQEDRDLAAQSDRVSANLHHIQQIEEAIRRLEEHPDRFGTCADCGKPINMARLEVIPYALACNSCANRTGKLAR